MEKVNGREKIALVTGANSGIGRELVRELSMRHVKVYMVVRDVEKGTEAKIYLVKKYGCDPTKLIVRTADLCNFKSIKQFANDFDSGKHFLPRIEF